MKTRSLAALTFALVFFYPSFPAWAQVLKLERDLVAALDATGSLRGGYFSASRKLDQEHDLGVGSVWLKIRPRLDENLSLVAEGWLRNDQSFHRHNSHGRLREGYLDFSTGGFKFRIGKQIIAWGRADELNPTDNLSPRDYTMLTPESYDQRFGAIAAKMTYHVNDLALTAIWLPRSNSNIFPLAATPGVSYVRQAAHSPQGAIKVEQSGGMVDWSVSYFNGLDLNPDIRIGALSAAGLELFLENKRIQVLGFDAATVIGRYGLRTEAAYTWTSASTDSLVKKPYLYAVMGTDRTFFDHLNINAQYYFRRVSSFQHPGNTSNPVLSAIAVQAAGIANQLDRFQHGISVRIANKWLNEALEGEIVGVSSLTRPDYVIKGKMVYAFNDRLKGSFGFDVFRGDRQAYYGRLRETSLAYMEMKYSF